MNIVQNVSKDQKDPQVKNKDHYKKTYHKRLTINRVSFNIRPHFLDQCAQKAVLPGQTTTDGLAS